MYICVTTDTRIKSSAKGMFDLFWIKTKFWPPKKKSNNGPRNYVKYTQVWTIRLIHITPFLHVAKIWTTETVRPNSKACIPAAKWMKAIYFSILPPCTLSFYQLIYLSFLQFCALYAQVFTTNPSMLTIFRHMYVPLMFHQ